MFKVGDKIIICKSEEALLKGLVGHVNRLTDRGFYALMEDEGYEFWFNFDNEINTSKYRSLSREQKLKRILNV